MMDCPARNPYTATQCKEQWESHSCRRGDGTTTPFVILVHRSGGLIWTDPVIYDRDIGSEVEPVIEKKLGQVNA